MKSNNTDDYMYDELKQMVKDYKIGKEIPCRIDEVDEAINKLDIEYPEPKECPNCNSKETYYDEDINRNQCTKCLTSFN